eukprot:TRINITY_DN54107_c0_g1_i1.p1 TRINITY_DN54107_c0_g1~~TRINITY_DN54107_c0_g1_i1.p1  ORF type:complete len:178 (+),score=39.11 TRINITY_DN54107_c0_g1_i1:59-592(+)
MPLELNNDYGFVLAAAGTIGVSQLFIGGGVMGLRKKFFTSKEFLAKPAVKAMAEEHKKAFQTEMNDLGYPDMGCGRYAQELEYAQWVEINNAQRAHYNMVESSGPVLACMLGAGLLYPKVCSALGFAYAAGRWMYAQGYKSSKGADGRVVGAILGALSSLGLFGTALIGGFSVALMK